MEEDTEFIKLPVEERCLHKLWKARVHGYEEIAKTFRQIDDEKSPEFARYLGHVKKFVCDSNALGQEKGLEAALAFVENYAHAGKTVGEVMAGVVSKCIAAPKAKTRELAVQVALMYVEIEKHDAVLEELLKGTEQKNPKIVSACVSTITLALREFGPKVVNVKPLVKKIQPLLADRDKAVRDETKAMAIEVYRWIGPALKPQLANLQPVQISELEAEFKKLGAERPLPIRYLRSQQEKQAKHVEAADEAAVTDDEGEDNVAPAIDPYDLVDPVDILSKLSKDFFEKVEAKKWQERKEALEELEGLLKAPKLENGDYGDLVRALKKMIAKDANVVVVALAGKCLSCLANGLKRRFQPYAGSCVSVLLEKFREKKQNVVMAMREALDAVFMATTIESILEDVVEALNNKNPSVKAETALFLARCFTKCQAAALNKKLLKAYTGALLKTLNEPDLTVRDSAAEALGTAMKLVGEKNIGPFLTDIDNLKTVKIKEYCDKAVIIAKPIAVKKERPNTAPAKITGPAVVKAGSTAPRPVKRPSTAAPINTATIVKKKISTKPKALKPIKPTERELSPEEVDSLASEILNKETLNGLSDMNWKTRLESVESIMQAVTESDTATISSQVFVKILNKKPGLKDTNFQVLKAKLDVVNMLAKNFPFSTVAADCCMNDVAEKLGDTKNSTTAADTLTSIAEATRFDFVANEVMNFAFTQKNPKVQSEALLWLSNSIKEFGFGIDVKMVVDYAKKALNATNPTIRNASIVLLGTVYMFMGSSLNMYFEDEKPAVKQQIFAEFEKYENVTPPSPVRGVTKSSSTPDILDEVEEEVETCEPVAAKDILPRTDINSLITEALIDELSDKNWKVRNEALQKVSNILSEAKVIQPSVGDLPRALSQRLVDSNSKIAQTALAICQTLCTAIGPRGKQHIRTIFPGVLQGLGDSKSWIRTASIDCMNTWGDTCGYKEFFEAEMIGDALKTGSPTLRTELWNWLAVKLDKVPPKSVPKEELLACLPTLYTNLEDRNADVRKNAQEAVLGFMIHLGYECMTRNTEKLKPGSKAVVMAALDKARPSLPMKPIPKGKSLVAVPKEEKTVRVVKSASSKTIGKAKVSVAGSKPPSRKNDEEIDTSPLLVVNNLRHQRVIDEQKLRVLKWNFTSPREEFVELLKQQMISANMNKTLIANMFHSDFRYHIRAIEALSEDIVTNNHALAANVDLILKWMTLRFFDTNPSVLLKGLEYLQLIFNTLIETDQRLLENEAASFIPYLILKAGDPKDAVRNGVRSLFKQIVRVFPANKLFGFVMEGLKSKNARQRSECLEALGNFIETYGISVCQPTPSACLKEIARQISDRDNSVRNAALNAVVQAYFLEGEKIYKMVGQISDKDLSLLEERIKRAAKKPPPQKNYKTSLLPQARPLEETFQPETPLDDADNMSEEEPEDIPTPSVIRTSLPKPPVTGPFGLSHDLLAELEKSPIAVPKYQLANLDLSFLDDNATPAARACVMPMSPPQQIALSPRTHSYNTTITNTSSTRIDQDYHLVKVINQIGNVDLRVAISAMHKVQDVLISTNCEVMQEHEDQFMVAITSQLKLLHPQDPATNADIANGYIALLTTLSAFYETNLLGSNVSTPVICDLLGHLVALLVGFKLDSMENSSSYSKIINMQCCKLIEKSNHTNLICAVIRVLQDSVRSSSCPKFTELVMKCLWRVIKTLPLWADDIDYDTVLLDIHIFFKEFPSSWWKQKSYDTPFRSIKTLVHSMAKIKGNALMSCFSKIPDPNESEFQSYLLKKLKTIKLEEVKQYPLKKDPRRPLSRTMHTMLSDIFRKIGTKEETKEGLNLLYDFRQQHPEAEIETFLKRYSKSLQDYIEKGLRDIEESRQSESRSALVSACNSIGGNKVSSTASLPAESESSYWMDKLKKWREVAGLETASNSNIDNRTNDENLNKTSTISDISDFPLFVSTQKTTTAAASDAQEASRSARMEELRRRLEAIKNSSKQQNAEFN